MGVTRHQRKIMNAIAETAAIFGAFIIGLIPTTIISRLTRPEQFEPTPKSFTEYILTLDVWQILASALFAWIAYLFITDKISPKQ